MTKEHEQIFTPQYKERSGPGSTVEYSEPYRKWLERFIVDNAIRSIVDLGCGDMAIMSNVALHNARYLGVDVIAERIAKNREAHPEMRFTHGDLRTFNFNDDLVLCKDVLQHWKTEEVRGWLEFLLHQRPYFRFALITNCNYGPTVNCNITTGGWRALDLTKPPFSIGEVVFRWGADRGGYKDVVLIRGSRG